MALYPTETISTPTSNNHYSIANNTLYAFPFTLGPGESKRIILMHTGVGKQDHSIRAWVSRHPGGSEVVHYPPQVAYWHPNRTPHEIVTVHDIEFPNGDFAALGLPPGDYYVCVLNLANQQNSFAYFLDSGAPTV